MTRYKLLPIIFLSCLIGQFSVMAADNIGVPRIVINPLGHSGKIFNLNYTPDGEKIISISEDKSIKVWDAETGEMIKQYYCQIGDGPEGILYSSAISPDGKYLAVGGYPVSGITENYIVLIDLETDKQVALGTGHINIITSLSFSFDGKYLASGGLDGSIIVWKVDPRHALIETSRINLGTGVNSLSFSPKTMNLAVASEQREVKVLNLSNMSANRSDYPTLNLLRHKGNVKFVRYSPDGRYIASCDDNHSLALWDSQGQLIKEKDDFENDVNTISFSLDGKVLVALNDVSGKGSSFSIPQFNKFTDFYGHDNSAGASDFSPKSIEGNYQVASAGGENNEVLIWNAINGKLIRKIKGVGSVVWDLQYLNDSELAVSNVNPESRSKNKSSVIFNLSTFQIRDSDGEIGFAANTGQSKDIYVPGFFEVQISGGGKILNDPNVDGRVLSVKKLDNGSIIVGSDLSLKQYDSDGNLRKEFVGHTGAIRAIAISPDQKFMATGGDDQTINIWNLEAAGNVPSMWEVYDDPSYHEFFTAYGLDSLAKVNNRQAWQMTIEFLADSKEKVYKEFQKSLVELGEQISPVSTLFIAEDGEWICFTPEGYFACSSTGGQYFLWEVNRGFENLAEYYQAEQYFDILFRPDIVKESIRTGKSATAILRLKGERVFDLTKLNRPSAGLFGKPVLTSGQTRGVELKRRTYTTESKRIRLNTDIYDGGGGVKEINIYQNNKLIIVDDQVKMYNQDHINKNYDVDLLNGSNDFKLVVINYQNIESRADHLMVDYVGELIATSELYVFSVGINEYKNSTYNLNYAQPDAAAFTDKIVERSKRMFKDVHVYELYNDKAIKESIVSTFKEITTSADPQDVFVFYYAGHGSIDSEDPNAEYYFVPHDVTKLYGDTQLLDEKGISSTELKNLLSDVKCQKQLILLDACHSGGAVKSFLTRSAASEEKAIFQLARSAGVVLIAASGTQQFATEFEVLKHGVFTYALLEGLDGKGNAGTDDRITVNELKAYMEDRVPELSLKYGGKAQYPTGFSNGQDFPISLILHE